MLLETLRVLECVGIIGVTVVRTGCRVVAVVLRRVLDVVRGEEGGRLLAFVVDFIAVKARLIVLVTVGLALQGVFVFVLLVLLVAEDTSTDSCGSCNGSTCYGGDLALGPLVVLGVIA